MHNHDYESESDDESCSGSGNPDADEKQHFLDVCWSLLGYRDDVMHDLGRMQDNVQELSAEDRELWPVDPMAWFTEIQRRVAHNNAFLRLLPSAEVCGAYLGPEGPRIVLNAPQGHRVASRNASKTRSTLRQFVRDWAVEGQAERDMSYTPIIEALKRHLPPPPSGQGQQPCVLCPGSGLGRLPFELVRAGYAAQGNEFSYHMLLGSHLILNRSTREKCFTIYPYVLSTCSRRGKLDHLRDIKIPDVCPHAALPADGNLSMAAGEFIEVYKAQTAEWDAVATCFFLDTAKNVLLYVRTIAHIIRPGGLWVNLGPLLYHFAEMHNEPSIELSWEELRPAICRYFDIVEETRREARYTGNPGSLMGVRYRCVLFVAVRNNVPTSGDSKPVYRE